MRVEKPKHAGVSPIQLLFISSIVGGLATPVSMAFLMLVGQNRKIMGDHAIGLLLRTDCWVTFAIVCAVSLFFLWQQFGSGLV